MLFNYSTLLLVLLTTYFWYAYRLFIVRMAYLYINLNRCEITILGNVQYWILPTFQMCIQAASNSNMYVFNLAHTLLSDKTFWLRNQDWAKNETIQFLITNRKCLASKIGKIAFNYSVFAIFGNWKWLHPPKIRRNIEIPRDSLLIWHVRVCVCVLYSVAFQRKLIRNFCFWGKIVFEVCM